MTERLAKRLGDGALLLLGVSCALWLRYLFRGVETHDFTADTSRWYAAIRASGLAATGTDVSNYTPPYLYLLYLVSIALPSLPPVMAVKVPSVLFDIICAGLVYAIVGLKYPQPRTRVLALLAVLLAPTVVVNGSFWGQADSIYTALLLACIYGLMRARTALAVAAFAAALSFKFQSIFLTPCLAALWARRRLPLWTLLLVPAVYAVAMLPAWLAGRPARALATVYLTQSGTFHDLTRNAPNLYAWLPQRFYPVLLPAGLVFMAALGAAFVWMVWRSRVALTPERILRLSLLSLLLAPYCLPKMHDRFFFPADVVSIAYAFYFPRQFYVPVAVVFASFCAYQPFLLGHAVIPLRLLALVMGAALAAVAHAAWRDLNAEGAGPEVQPEPR
jgi:Gpi18-like mannosyltransferase